MDKKEPEEDKENYNQPPWVASVLASEDFTEAMYSIRRTRLRSTVRKTTEHGFRGLVESVLKSGHRYNQPPWTAFVLSTPATLTSPVNGLTDGSGNQYYVDDGQSEPYVVSD